MNLVKLCQCFPKTIKEEINSLLQGLSGTDSLLSKTLKLQKGSTIVRSIIKQETLSGCSDVLKPATIRYANILSALFR